MDTSKQKAKVIEAGKKAVDELIRIAKDPIKDDEGLDLSADRLKNAAATKKLAIFDAFDILEKISQVDDDMKAEEEEKKLGKDRSNKGFAERRAG